ncbi:protein-tyrosine phosphatase family protein [Horticoccus sp. 23ND18S-11]|uniref:hypothetical protein n=1 Tax=Horticoccus sp. 23ND18S-11 TaxID=3391832 RepID=UPI0039C950B7
MSQSEAIHAHHLLCDEIHQCVLDENRFLRQQQRAPDAAFLERKRTLLTRLDTTLATLRTLPAASARDPATRDELEKTRARILQILQLDKENEQLLLRCSLSSHRPSAATPAPAASVTMLQKIYARCS